MKNEEKNPETAQYKCPHCGVVVDMAQDWRYTKYGDRVYVCYNCQKDSWLFLPLGHGKSPRLRAL